VEDDILDLAFEVSRVTGEKISLIESIMRQTSFLALNARLEAARAGPAGAAFAIVANEMGTVSSDITAVAKDLRGFVQNSIARIEQAGAEMQTTFRGVRFVDAASNAVEIMDRNLYERSCDVRWWATDNAIVEVLQRPSDASRAFASRRLATILRSYTVYLDLWVLDAAGRVVATGRPEAYPDAVNADMSGMDWFCNAMRTSTGDEFAVADITTARRLGATPVATYATAIREDGEPDGRALGALAIFFDWAPQASTIVKGVGLSAEEKAQTRTMLLDGDHRVIAASDDQGLLKEVYRLDTGGRPRGYYLQDDRLVAFALTPGYETYRGLGWYGVIEYRLEARAAPCGA